LKKNKTLSIFSTSRADYGIFKPLLSELEKSKEIDYKLFIGGAHLLSEQGKTINDVNFTISDKFDFFLNNDDSVSLTKSLGIEFFELANIFKNYGFDFVCILGDRYELLPIVNTAIIYKKPIIHIHGGETSQGAIDEQIRHMISKAAHIHFVSCQEYADNIINMGESKFRVFNTGALGVDNVFNEKRIAKRALFNDLNLDEHKKTVLLTYHPVTLEYKISPFDQINNLFIALEKYKEIQVVITTPNIEVDKNNIMAVIKSKIKKDDRYKLFKSLGTIRYHSLIPHCEFVIGNSSSGIIEIPYFHIPTINVGDRQKGRIRHDSIIDTDYSVESIHEGIDKALSSKFRDTIKSMLLKFGNGNAAKKMTEIIKNIKIDDDLMRKELDFRTRHE